jgi:hypothetical protein
MRLFGFAVLVLALGGCSTYRDELARGQRAFEQNQHERALAVLRGLENDTSHLDTGERARYAYLRGMTDYRVGYKADARHWLAVARATAEAQPGALPADWRARLDEAMTDLDAQVIASGIESLGTVKRPVSPDAASKAKPRAADAVDEDEDAPKPATKKKPKKPVDEDE